jgi:hypothetical protein
VFDPGGLVASASRHGRRPASQGAGVGPVLPRPPPPLGDLPDLPAPPNQRPPQNEFHVCMSRIGEDVITLPPFSAVFPATRRCFELEYGQSDHWPSTPCCPPLRKSVPGCAPLTQVMPPIEPTTNAALARLAANPVVGITPAPPWDLVYSALGILRDNADIVEWALCLVGNYSPDLGLPAGWADAVMGLVMDESKYFVMAVGSFGSGASAGAFSRHTNPGPHRGKVGLVIPFQGAAWVPSQPPPPPAPNRPTWGNTWRATPDGSFCTAVSVAGELLHEMVHIEGNPIHGLGGAIHRPTPQFVCGGNAMPCWEETRMVASLFRWAMLQRARNGCDAVMCSGARDDPRAVLGSGCLITFFNVPPFF